MKITQGNMTKKQKIAQLVRLIKWAVGEIMEYEDFIKSAKKQLKELQNERNAKTKNHKSKRHTRRKT